MTQPARPLMRVPAEGTAPERRARAALRALGLSFRVNARDLPGTPDIVVDALRAVVMVHGCFWHLHQECPRGLRVPNALWRRRGYWEEKLVRNALRDRRVEEDLAAAGWRVIVVWECELTSRRRAVALLAWRLGVERLRPRLRRRKGGSSKVHAHGPARVRARGLSRRRERRSPDPNLR